MERDKIDHGAIGFGQAVKSLKGELFVGDRMADIGEVIGGCFYLSVVAQNLKLNKTKCPLEMF